MYAAKLASNGKTRNYDRGVIPFRKKRCFFAHVSKKI